MAEKKCSKCLIIKLIECFYGKATECKSCSYQRTKDRRRNHPELCPTCGRVPSPGFKTCHTCQERQRKRGNPAPARRLKGLCPRCGQVPSPLGTRCLPCKIKDRETYARLKDRVIQVYGGACTCCGEKRIPFLCLDHVFDNGWEHRKGLKTTSMYKWAHSNGYPPMLQILCANCNQAKQISGVCPHKESLV